MRSQTILELIENENLTENIYRLTFNAPEKWNDIVPGQFINIKLSEFLDPFLRRPFSIHDAFEGKIQILFNVTGKGTKILSELKPGEKVDAIGPLGKGFNLEDDFEIAVIVAGGLGIAPFPFLVRKLMEKNKKIVTFIGARTKSQVITTGLVDFQIATDDGSAGFKGNVVELLNLNISKFDPKTTKIFGCGPTPMLKSLAKLCDEKNFNCEISVETPMACGVGICQGCVVETKDVMSKFKLACKDGPVFNIKEIIFR